MTNTTNNETNNETPLPVATTFIVEAHPGRWCEVLAGRATADEIEALDFEAGMDADMNAADWWEATVSTVEELEELHERALSIEAAGGVVLLAPIDGDEAAMWGGENTPGPSHYYFHETLGRGYMELYAGYAANEPDTEFIRFEYSRKPLNH